MFIWSPSVDTTLKRNDEDHDENTRRRSYNVPYHHKRYVGNVKGCRLKILTNDFRCSAYLVRVSRGAPIYRRALLDSKS